jgi:hypothetical protein
VKGKPVGTSKEISGLENKHLSPGILESSNPFHQEYFVCGEGNYEREQEKMDPASTDRSGQGNAGGKRAGRLQDLEAYRHLSYEKKLPEKIW